MRNYSKALVAIAGAGVTAALGIYTGPSTAHTVLIITSAVITAAGVYLVPNIVDEEDTDE